MRLFPTALVAAILGGAGPLEDKPVRLERMLKDWETAIRPLDQGDEAFLDWISMLDPRPPEAFVKFTTEKIDPWIVKESEKWFGIFFKDEANPFKHTPRKPTRYSMAADPSRLSLLMYEW